MKAGRIPQAAHLPAPAPEEVRAARKRAGLTQTQAAQVIGTAGEKGYRTWQRFEFPVGNADHREMNPALWELFLLRTDQHPVLRLARRRKPVAAAPQGKTRLKMTKG